ncbi:MAG TPA: zf-HC2 domain-containing protein [Tepidisphaeraceae bacterium]|jgi:anti-sigma factor RsiW
MTCSRSSEIQAYYDGELSVEQRESVERHVRECGECAALLEDLPGLSNLLSTVPLSEMRSGAERRLYGAWNKTTDRGVLRIAGWLTAAAAAVLVGASLNFNMTQRTNVATASHDWEAAALVPPVETAHEENRSDVVVIAQWMADDLGVNERGVR